MNEWQVLLLIGGILTFCVGTIIPLIKIVNGVSNTLKGNSDTIAKNTEMIDTVKDAMNETNRINREEHKQFFKEINHLNNEMSVVATKVEYLENNTQHKGE